MPHANQSVPTETEDWPIAKLIPYARNARTHSPEQVAQIAASIREFGFTVPVLVDEQGTLIAGHGRLLGAQQLGITDVPTMVARGWTAAQIQAYRLADNQLALNAGWDRELLGLELGELKLGGFDLALTGFGELELGDLLADRTQGLTDPDDAPEAPEHPVSRTGDLWLLGRHRLLCGDSTVAADVERVLGGGVEPHLMVTDPPYGVEYDPAWRQLGWTGPRAIGKVENDGRSDWREAWSLFPGDVAYVWHASLKVHEVADSLISTGMELRATIIWVKQHFQISRGHWQRRRPRRPAPRWPARPVGRHPPQRPLPLRLRKEIQALPRPGLAPDSQGTRLLRRCAPRNDSGQAGSQERVWKRSTASAS